jgi:hypothetical protein
MSFILFPSMEYEQNHTQLLPPGRSIAGSNPGWLVKTASNHGVVLGDREVQPNEHKGTKWQGEAGR